MMINSLAQSTVSSKTGTTESHNMRGMNLTPEISAELKFTSPNLVLPGTVPGPVGISSNQLGSNKSSNRDLREQNPGSSNLNLQVSLSSNQESGPAASPSARTRAKRLSIARHNLEKKRELSQNQINSGHVDG